MSSAEDINALENSGILVSPMERAGGAASYEQSPFLDFINRFFHSLDSTGSSYVSTTRWQFMARSFANTGDRGSVYRLTFRRGDLYRAWHSPYFLENELLVRSTTKPLSWEKLP